MVYLNNSLSEWSVLIVYLNGLSLLSF